MFVQVSAREKKTILNVFVTHHTAVSPVLNILQISYLLLLSVCFNDSAGASPSRKNEVFDVCDFGSKCIRLQLIFGRFGRRP